MSFKVIKGTFHITGYSPDGDSIRFKADNDNDWSLLEGGKVRLNKKGHAQLRIEAIDTLETHYKCEHQPPEFAKLATDTLFSLLGIKQVVWNAAGSKVASASDGTKGYVVSRMAEKYGRPVSFVFPESAELSTVKELFLDGKTVKKSVNYKLLKKGLAYPTFYDGMFYDLRELFAKAAVSAREKKKGLWEGDRTNRFFTVGSLSDITDTHVLLPKLFRRITAYMKIHGSFHPLEFKKWLEADPEKVLILSILHFTHLDNLIITDKKGRIKLTTEPENLVFLG
ncbi:MAG: thermonuclease family protein [Spirochaetales bacterium]|nr:thermonuclease family protein [Spirochaetales bacterium]